MIKEFSPKQMSNIQKIRRFVYIFVIVVGLFNIIFPYTVSADIFNNDTQDVYVTITENVKESNDLLKKAFQFCQDCRNCGAFCLSDAGTGHCDFASYGGFL